MYRARLSSGGYWRIMIDGEFMLILDGYDLDVSDRDKLLSGDSNLIKEVYDKYKK
jgi:hypothetical protein